MEILHACIEFGAMGMEAMAVAIIVGAFLYASARFVIHKGRHALDPYERYKAFLGRALILGLEFLVAADVIRTVALAPTLLNVGILGAVILVRDFLTVSISVELHRRWPWQRVLGSQSA